MDIRLVCSDIDGTLLQYGKKELEGEIFEQIRALHQRGIWFCPASGRQYTSLRKLFAPVADCCVFICENGGTIFQEEQCIAKNPMPRALAEEIANDMWTRSEGAGRGDALRPEHRLPDGARSWHAAAGAVRGQPLPDHSQPRRGAGGITKVSVYLHEGVENYVERFVPRWKQANCAVAGPFWIDTTFANKGIGVQCVCRILGIDLAQVMAFGDNYNDETMLDVVGVPYIMDNAAAPLRAKYQNHTPRPEDVLAQLLAQQP